MKKFFSGLALLSAVVVLASCEDDIFGWGNGSHRTYGENEIAFTIGGKKGMNTRADQMRTIVAPSNVIDLPREEGEPQLCLVETVSSMDDEIFDAVNGGTRGTPIYTENFDDNYAGDLYVTAFQIKENPSSDTDEKVKTEYTAGEVWGSYLEGNGTVQYKKVEGVDHTYSYDYSKGQSINLAWPDSEKLYFFLQAPDMSSSVENLTYFNDGSFEFNYTSPVKAEGQKDLLFGSRIITKEQNDEHKAHEVLLYHVFTGVKFKVGSSQYLENIQFTGVEMTLKGKGSCTVTPNYDYSTFDVNNKKEAPAPALSKSADCSKWTLTDANAQLFTVDFSNLKGTAGTADGEDTEDGRTIPADTYNPADGYFPKSFYRQTEGAQGTVADHNLNDAVYSKTFFVIPQNISEDTSNPTTITVYYTVNGKPGAKEVILPAAIWKAGELRTFTLDALMVDVEITDDASGDGTAGSEKDNLKTTNTGTAPEYQRVALTANWVYYDEQYGDVIIDTYPIVTAGTDSDHPAYVNTEGFSGFPGFGWYLGDDGFFYYAYPIEPGATPNIPLFESFVIPDKAPNGAHLEMDITVQAVKFEPDQTTVKTYWKMGNNSGPKRQDFDTPIDGLHPKHLKRFDTGQYVFDFLEKTVE